MGLEQYDDTGHPLGVGRSSCTFCIHAEPEAATADSAHIRHPVADLPCRFYPNISFRPI